LQGRMFAPLGIAYILAIFASLVVALTVTPALACLLFRRDEAVHTEPRFLGTLRDVYSRILERVMHHRGPVVVACLIACALAIFGVWRFGEEFLPEFREGHFVVQVSAAPGTSLPEMMRIGEKISHSLLNDIKVGNETVIDTVEQQAGRAELGEDPWGPHRCEFHVELKPDVPGRVQAQVQQQIRDLLEGFPGISSEVLTFLGDRIGETLTGETAPVVVSLYGNDLDALDDKAQEVARVIHGVRGAEDVKVSSPPGAAELLITLRPDRLQAMGFQPLEVLTALEIAYQGTVAAKTYQGSRVFDVLVILEPRLRRDPESVASLLVSNQDGRVVRLGDLADIDRRTGRYMILHDGGRRRQAVTCSAAGRDLGGFVDELRDVLKKVRLPPATYLTITGAAEASEAGRSEILLHSSLVGVAILLLLAAVFRNARNLILVLVNLPFAFVGGVLAVALTGASLSIGSIVGFVTLFGITMRNSVMMISHFDHLVNLEGETWSMHAALRGASERLIPILMTALVTGLGLLPIALGSGEVGREIEGPMAIVILGGLISSTALNLLVLPALALAYGRFGTAHPREP
ncbi:MAG TPA: efflux RND transporter permease subunit, partial [Phycisphaerae bacterium]|nr:efflux RND transporter permease subunit [Phycisphaerae bacterium]